MCGEPCMISMYRVTLSPSSMFGSMPCSSHCLAAATRASACNTIAADLLIGPALCNVDSIDSPRRSSKRARRLLSSFESQASVEDWLKLKGLLPLRLQLVLLLQHFLRVLQFQEFPLHQELLRHHYQTQKAVRKDLVHRHLHRNHQ